MFTLMDMNIVLNGFMMTFRRYVVGFLTVRNNKINTMEKFRKQFEKEKGRTYWAEGCDYGSFNDEYVKWLEQRLKNCNIPLVSGSLHIDFAVYLTGHDKETIEQMYNDWRQ